ncbi:hypothetical protein FGO68_gene13019 [Halteria grandinella]|uniref:Uncharacterized protein n=1 Tax=Halteria grandinella TaxID=5974 RepID=A0A8J8T7H9_HALGN|nr:hypothetical protein FGO68_gene13019 [Halteria grandinella]
MKEHQKVPHLKNILTPSQESNLSLKLQSLSDSPQVDGRQGKQGSMQFSTFKHLSKAFITNQNATQVTRLSPFRLEPASVLSRNLISPSIQQAFENEKRMSSPFMIPLSKTSSFVVGDEKIFNSTVKMAKLPPLPENVRRHTEQPGPKANKIFHGAGSVSQDYNNKVSEQIIQKLSPQQYSSFTKYPIQSRQNKKSSSIQYLSQGALRFHNDVKSDENVKNAANGGIHSQQVFDSAGSINKPQVQKQDLPLLTNYLRDINKDESASIDLTQVNALNIKERINKKSIFQDLLNQQIEEETIQTVGSSTDQLMLEKKSILMLEQLTEVLEASRRLQERQMSLIACQVQGQVYQNQLLSLQPITSSIVAQKQLYKSG